MGCTRRGGGTVEGRGSAPDHGASSHQSGSGERRRGRVLRRVGEKRFGGEDETLTATFFPPQRFECPKRSAGVYWAHPRANGTVAVDGLSVFLQLERCLTRWPPRRSYDLFAWCRIERSSSPTSSVLPPTVRVRWPPSTHRLQQVRNVQRACNAYAGACQEPLCVSVRQRCHRMRDLQPTAPCHHGRTAASRTCALARTCSRGKPECV